MISSTFSLTDREMMTGGEGGSLSQPGIRSSREDEAWKSRHRGAAAAAKTAEGRKSQRKMEKEEEKIGRKLEEESRKEEEERLEREERASTRQIASEQVAHIVQLIHLTFPMVRRGRGKSYLKQRLGDKRRRS